MIDIKTLKPLKNDVVIVMRPKREVTSQLIFTKESIDDSDMQFFDVVRAADQCKHVKAGDVIVMSWKRITVPQEGLIDGVTKQFGITSEDEIDGIVEGLDED